MAAEQPLPGAGDVNPLPYILVFAFLFLILLAILTYLLVQFKRLQSCQTNPGIWCDDSWTCSQSCTPTIGPDGRPAGRTLQGGIVSVCFVNIKSTGLASCLFGPTADGATTCLGGPETQPGQTTCNCPLLTATDPNSCLKGCPLSIGGVAPNVPCCFKGSTNPACAVQPTTTFSTAEIKDKRPDRLNIK